MSYVNKILMCMLLYMSFDSVSSQNSVDNFLNSLGGSGKSHVNKKKSINPDHESKEITSFLSSLHDYYGDPDYQNGMRILQDQSLQETYISGIEQIQETFFLAALQYNTGTEQKKKHVAGHSANQLSSFLSSLSQYGSQKPIVHKTPSTSKQISSFLSGLSGEGSGQKELKNDTKLSKQTRKQKKRKKKGSTKSSVSSFLSGLQG